MCLLARYKTGIIFWCACALWAARYRKGSDARPGRYGRSWPPTALLRVLCSTLFNIPEVILAIISAARKCDLQHYRLISTRWDALILSILPRKRPVHLLIAEGNYLSAGTIMINHLSTHKGCAIHVSTPHTGMIRCILTYYRGHMRIGLFNNV